MDYDLRLIYVLSVLCHKLFGWVVNWHHPYWNWFLQRGFVGKNPQFRNIFNIPCVFEMHIKACFYNNHYVYCMRPYYENAFQIVTAVSEKKEK